MFTNIIQTAAGAVEVEIQGSGLPILVLHGSPCGIDGAIAMSRFLEQARFKTICLSRPGYLGTPLNPQTKSIDHEADLLAAVLDTINVERVGVLAWSGGGPVAFRLAIRHPSRVNSIVAIAAVSGQITIPKPSLADRFMGGTAIGERSVTFLVRKQPLRVVTAALENEGSVRGEKLALLIDQVMAKPEQRRLILEIAPTVNTGGKRQNGWQNDLANFGRIDSLELEKVYCPVLLVHGAADTDVPPEHSRLAHTKLPNSTLVEMEDGTHLSFYADPMAEEVQEKTRRWFSEYQ